MKANFQSVNFTADRKLLSFIQRRLDKLQQYHSRIISSEVFLKVENNHAKDNKSVEIKMHVPGQELVVKKQGKSFEEAADLGSEALRRQLRKYKEKSRASA